MAGVDATGSFVAADFRTAIRSAMTMGAPDPVGLQTTFIVPEVSTYAPQGPDLNPYDFTQVPVTDVAAQSVVVPSAVEFAIAAATAEGMGEFDASRATITLLDEDYALVSRATKVLIGGITYTIDAPGAVPLGLFDVTVYQFHVSALG